MATLIGSVAGGGVNDLFSAGDLAGTRYQASGNGVADQCQINVRSGSTFTSITVGIYSDSASLPNVLLGQSAAITDNTAGTKTAAISAGPTITSGTFYWLFVLAQGGAYNYTGNSGVTGYRGQSGLSGFETPWNTTGDFTDSTSGSGIPILIEAIGGGSTTAPLGDPWVGHPELGPGYGPNAFQEDMVLITTSSGAQIFVPKRLAIQGVG